MSTRLPAIPTTWGLCLAATAVLLGPGWCAPSPIVAAQESEKKPRTMTSGWAGDPLYAGRVNPKLVGRRHGGAAADKVVLSALRWLRRHQDPEGFWSGDAYTVNCKSKRQRCENELSWHHSKGPGWDHVTPGVTALALMAFVSRGNTHLAAEDDSFRSVIDRGMRWLLAQQEQDPKVPHRGRIAGGHQESGAYAHAIATGVLAEILLGSGDEKTLREPVTRALEYCLKAQTPKYGWRYGIQEGNDTSVTLWMGMALRAGQSCAKAGLIDIAPDQFLDHTKWAVHWLDRVTAGMGKTGYIAPGDPGAQLQDSMPSPYPYSKDLSPMTAGALFFRDLVGSPAESRSQSLRLLIDNPPRWAVHQGERKSTINFYYWYYATHALFQAGGEEWKNWNKLIKRVLVKNQRGNGCERGSWDPVGEWGVAGGRVYTTAIGALTLEVYYRYARVAEAKEEK